MLVIFLIGVAPKEYLHDLIYDHKDTVHKELHDGEVTIGNKHTHCSFLGFAFAPFVPAEPVYFAFEAGAEFTDYYLVTYTYLHSSVHVTPSLRGPPAAVCHGLNAIASV